MFRGPGNYMHKAPGSSTEGSSAEKAPKSRETRMGAREVAILSPQYVEEIKGLDPTARQQKIKDDFGEAYTLPHSEVVEELFGDSNGKKFDHLDELTRDYPQGEVTIPSFDEKGEIGERKKFVKNGPGSYDKRPLSEDQKDANAKKHQIRTDCMFLVKNTSH